MSTEKIFQSRQWVRKNRPYSQMSTETRFQSRGWIHYNIKNIEKEEYKIRNIKLALRADSINFLRQLKPQKFLLHFSFSPHIIPLLFKYSTLCSLCQSFRNRNRKRKATAPPAREGFCCEARFRAEQQKGWAGEAPFLGISRPEKTYRRKRNKPLQSDDFPSLRLSVREKFLKWCQTHLEEGFWTLQRKVRLSQFHFLYKLEFHFQIPHFIFEN